MAQYAVLIYAHDSAHAPDATPEDLQTCDQHSDELTTHGSMIMAYALTPRAMATSIRGDTITDGPFVDSKEIVAGFYIIEAPDLRRRLADLASCGHPRQPGQLAHDHGEAARDRRVQA